MKTGDIVLSIRYYNTSFDDCLSFGLQPVVIGRIESITDDELFAEVVSNGESHFCWLSELVLLKGV